MSEIREFILHEPLFETHEHMMDLAKFDDFRTHQLEGRGFRDFLSYANGDINTAAGIDSAIFEKDRDSSAFFTLWEHVRTTGYGQAISLGTQKLFGLSLTQETSGQITQCLQDFIKDKPAQEVFETIYAKANVIGAICDRNDSAYKDLTLFSGDKYPSFIKQALRLDRYIYIDSKDKIAEFEAIFKTSITTLKDLLSLIHEHAEKANQTGNMVAFKMGIAYQRNISFENTSFETARRIFDELLTDKNPDLTPLQDYIAHYVIQLAEEFKRPLQIHTGHLAGNWHDVRNSNPADLIPLFLRYRNVRFDVFHASWPFSEFIASVGKTFPNVWLDMCWAWAMNPVQMERTLDEWLACVPNNKIFGFGGDTWNPFSMIGYAEQARKGIANVLEKKVSTGEYDLETARFVAGRIMHKNAEEFFGIA